MQRYDNVILNPDLYVDDILKDGFYDFKDGDNTFKNVSLRDDDLFYKFLMKKYDDYEIVLNFIRQSPINQEEPNYIHSDEMMGDLTAILYLNKNHPKGYGTTIYFDNKSIESIYLAKYNSCLIFNSNRLHSRNLENNFGEGNDSRLIQVVFLKKHKLYKR